MTVMKLLNNLLVWVYKPSQADETRQGSPN